MGVGVATSWDGFKWLIERETDKDAIGRHEELPITYLQKLGMEFKGRNRLFVDVGANVGMYAIRMKDYYDKIVAIEPDPENYAILNHNISLNFSKDEEVNIFPLNIAAGDINGEAILESKGVGSRIVAKAAEGAEVHGLEKVRIARLDTLLPGIFDLEKFGLIVVKIDVEGFEEFVIKGAEGLIGKYPIYWLIEHHEFRGFKNLKSLRKIIRALRPYYYAINLNQVQWLYAPKSHDPKHYAWPVACHWLYKCIDNIESGRPWYFGLPGKWWHGKSLLDFYETLKEMAASEPVWLEKL